MTLKKILSAFIALSLAAGLFASCGSDNSKGDSSATSSVTLDEATVATLDITEITESETEPTTTTEATTTAEATTTSETTTSATTTTTVTTTTITTTTQATTTTKATTTTPKATEAPYIPPTELKIYHNITLPSPASAVSAKTKIPADISANELLQDMKSGINLGNTFDAANKIELETNWGAPKTTQAIIDGMKEAGFNAVRIPFSWTGVSDASTHKIDDKALKRLKEVVDYCINNDMYVIINSHHDNNENGYDLSNDSRQQTKEYITNIWAQIATYFKNYDNHVIFESMNEPQGTEPGVNIWWPVGDELNKQGWKDILRNLNEANQTFVDTVRATGGNNKDRFLLVPGVTASALTALTSQFKIPTDSSQYENRILISVHNYSPAYFCFDCTDPNFSPTSSDAKSISNEFENLYNKFTSKGVGVIIGEWASADQNNESERAEHAKFVVGEAAKRGIVCFWWDNNNMAVGVDGFSIYDRKNVKWRFPTLTKAITGNADIAEIG